MKNIFAVLGLCAMLAVQSCDTKLRPEEKTSVDKVDPGERDSPNVNQDNVNDNTANTASADAEMAYICPMRCEGSASNEPGNCPVCKMELVKNPNYKGGLEGTQPNEAINHEPSADTQPQVDDKLEQ